MKVIVLGAGVVGVTTAYQLHKDGHEVTVIDREPAPASFTSYANAGLFAPGHAYAWSSPAAPGILLKSLWRNDQALRFRPTTDPAFWRWMWRFWNECTAEKAALNTTRKVRLCLYSQSVFHDTVADTGVDYDGRQGGLLFLYRSPDLLKGAEEKAEILRDQGCEIDLLDRDGMVKADPALEGSRDRFAGALISRNDESGDCRKFTQGLAQWLEGQGVRFLWDTRIEGFDIDADAIAGVVTDKGKQSADSYVLSLGIYSPHMARKLGSDLPIYPVKGYSVTVPVAGRNNPPAIGGVDEENLVAYCPLGNRLRMTATAEFSGYANTHKPGDFRHMLNVARELFPDGADYSQAEYWAGLRPMTPQGTPIIGRGRHRNLWYNTGQGHMGWTMSHGCARICSDLMSGRQPQIPLEGMQLAA